MRASLGSASESKNTAEHSEGSTLFSGVNWLGDSIMTMPAIREFKTEHPESHLSILAKPSLVPLWLMSPDIECVFELRPGPTGAVKAALALKRLHFTQAFILTQSFRSALIPFLAGIPKRTGMPGHGRDWMLTSVISPTLSGSRQHQAFEYLDLLHAERSTTPIIPPINIPDGVSAECRQMLKELLPNITGRPLVGMLPGAAHGPSKRWPADCFREVAVALVRQHGCRLAVFGTRDDSGACATITTGMEGSAADFSGQTDIPKLAAMLALCNVVIANDSGGMHLAAAVGTSVVALFGLTDPGKTGPLGSGHRILTSTQINRSRDLAPDSKAAAEALLSIRPRDVLQATLANLGLL